LANLLYRERDSIVFNTHYDRGGLMVFKQACALGCEGIVSKGRGSPYRSGRADHWLPVTRRQSLSEFIGRTLAGAGLRAPRGPRACAPRP
jgi:ATP-dependent DNA ligase